MGHIIALPPFLPDEDYRSILFRYHLRSPYSSYIKSRKELIGRAISKPILYPQQLMRLKIQLGVSDQFLMSIIQNHTFYPLYRPFMDEAKHANFLDSMLEVTPSPMNVKLLMQRQRQNLIHFYAHYCPLCLEEDFKMFGECYLHRMHQFCNVSVCPKHAIPLLTHCQVCGTPFGTDTGSLFLHEPRCTNGHPIRSRGDEVRLGAAVENYLADVYSLMNATELNLDILYTKLIADIGSREFIHFRGDYIFKKRLLTECVEHFGEDYLKALGISIDTLFNEKYMVEFLNKQHLRKWISIYLLLMRFLSGSVKSFLNKESASYAIQIPFGNGPWICVNNICPFYRQKIITRCKRKAHEWITGNFTCPHCGLIYTRKGHPKEENEEQFSIETRGHLFIELAARYYQEGLNINEISIKLLSNKTSVRKYLSLYRKKIRNDSQEIDMELITKQLELGPRQAAATMRPKLETCKETVLCALKVLGPKATQSELRRYNIHRYDWVMKYDRNWMEAQLPPRRSLPKELKRESMDDDLYAMVAQAFEEVNRNPPKTRICKAEIFRRLPSYVQSRVYNYSDALPKTIQYLEQHVESIDQCLVRRLPQVVAWFEHSRYRKCSLKLIQSYFPAYRKGSEITKKWVEEQVQTMVKSPSNNNFY